MWPHALTCAEIEKLNPWVIKIGHFKRKEPLILRCASVTSQLTWNRLQKGKRRFLLNEQPVSSQIHSGFPWKGAGDDGAPAPILPDHRPVR